MLGSSSLLNDLEDGQGEGNSEHPRPSRRYVPARKQVFVTKLSAQILPEVRNTGFQRIPALCTVSTSSSTSVHRPSSPLTFALASPVCPVFGPPGSILTVYVAYPDGHPDKEDDLEQELQRLKNKVDAGADFIVTQLFYDIDRFISWQAQARARGSISGTVSELPLTFTQASPFRSSRVSCLYKRMHRFSGSQSSVALASRLLSISLSRTFVCVIFHLSRWRGLISGR
jgi:hypothetical protein